MSTIFKQNFKTNKHRFRFFTSSLLILFWCSYLSAETSAEDLLPPLAPWHGNSEALLVGSDNPWQTPAEKTQLTDTPDYLETILFLDKLVESDNRLQKLSLGKSPQGRDIWMIVATKEGFKQPQQLKQMGKPTLLLQAGIHSGEIDGKDAGLMLLRDIIHGNKGSLLEKVNLLFVPILSVDGHQRRSPYNRVNQRGPTHMGWRTNAQNLNLNRDYTKLDSLELQHLISAINRWGPDLYYDVHVTDGEDYQYDITYGFTASDGDSPNISQWLTQQLRPSIDQALSANGHLGGPLTFGVNSMEFSDGISGWRATPRFSNGYGDVRHLATVLVENHSLKPYKQRVLGTYVMLEATLKLLAIKGHQLIRLTEKDRSHRAKTQVVAWETNRKNPTFMDYYGIQYIKSKDETTGLEYITWTGDKKLYKDLPIYWMSKATITVDVPKSYWIPAQYIAVIKRLKIHGIQLITHPKAQKISGIQKLVNTHTFLETPFEGHQVVKATFNQNQGNFTLPQNSVEVRTDQPLGKLVVALLEPSAPDSFFSWGFFNQIFQKTEYIENYAMIPLAKQLFLNNPDLKKEFNQKKNSDETFLKDPKKQLQWIYSKSKFYDQEYLKYPVIIQPQ